MEKIDKTNRGFSVRETKLDNGQVKLKLAVLPVPKREQPDITSVGRSTPNDSCGLPDHCGMTNVPSVSNAVVPVPAPLVDRGKWRPIGFTPSEPSSLPSTMPSMSNLLSRQPLPSPMLLSSTADSTPFLSCFGASSSSFVPFLDNSSSLKPFQISAAVKPAVATLISPVNQLYRCAPESSGHATTASFKHKFFGKNDQLLSSGSDTDDVELDNDSEEKLLPPVFHLPTASNRPRSEEEVSVHKSSPSSPRGEESHIRKASPKNASRRKQRELDLLLNTWTVAPTAGKLLRSNDTSHRTSRRSLPTGRRSPAKSPATATATATDTKVTPDKKISPAKKNSQTTTKSEELAKGSSKRSLPSTSKQEDQPLKATAPSKPDAPPKPAITQEQIDSVLSKLSKVAVSPDSKTKTVDGGKSCQRSGKSFKFLSTLTVTADCIVSRKRFCASAVFSQSESVAETFAQLPPKKRHKQLSPMSTNLSKSLPFDADTLSKLLARQSAVIAFLRPSLFDLKREHDEKIRAVAALTCTLAASANNSVRHMGQKPKPNANKTPPLPAAQPKDQEPVVAENSVERHPLKLRISLSKILASRISSNGPVDSKEALHGRKVKRKRSLPDINPRVGISRVITPEAALPSRAGDSSPSYGLRTRRSPAVMIATVDPPSAAACSSQSLSTRKELRNKVAEKGASSSSPPPVPIPLPVNSGANIPPSVVLHRKRGRPPIKRQEFVKPEITMKIKPNLAMPARPGLRSKVESETTEEFKQNEGEKVRLTTKQQASGATSCDSGSKISRTVADSDTTSGKTAKLKAPTASKIAVKSELEPTIGVSSESKSNQAIVEKRRGRKPKVDRPLSLKSADNVTLAKLKGAINQQRAKRMIKKESEDAAPLVRLKKQLVDRAVRTKRSTLVPTDEKSSNQPEAEAPQPTKKASGNVKALAATNESLTAEKSEKAAKRQAEDTFKEERPPEAEKEGDKADLTSEMSSLASPTSELSGGDFFASSGFSPMNSPSAGASQIQYSGAVLPLPPPAALSMLYERSYFELPFDLWISQKHNLLSRPNHPGESFRRLRSNLYTPSSRQIIGGRSEPPEPCRCVVNDEKICLEDCINKQLFVECSAESCPCFAKCLNKRFQNGCDFTKIARFETSECGSGIKAKKPMKVGEFIVEYTGEVVTEREFRRRMAEWYVNDEHHYAFNLDAGLVIDAYRMGSLARFVNHSCEPNAEMQKWTVLGYPRVGLFALKDIEPGEELTYDYHFNWFDQGSRQICKCGKPSCRGYIGACNPRRNSLDSAASKKPIQPLATWRLANQPRPLSFREAQTVANRHVFLRRNFRRMASCLIAISAKLKRRTGVVIAQASAEGLVFNNGCTNGSNNGNNENSLFVAQFKALATTRSVSTRKLSEAESSSASKSVEMALFLEQLLTSLMMHRDNKEIQVAVPFINLPKRKQCPAYYDRVPKPIDFSTIERNITTGRYPTFDSFNDDVRLLLENVRLGGDLLLSSSTQEPSDVEPVFCELSDTYDKLLCTFEAEISELRKLFPLAELEDVVRCICSRHNEEGTMVQCEKCQLWQHTDCVGVNVHAIPDSYICYVCSGKSLSREVPLPSSQLPPDAQSDCRYYLTMLTKSGTQVRVDECYTIYRQSLPFDVPFCKIDKLYPGIFYVDRLYVDKNNRKFIYGVHLVYPFEVHVDHSRRFFPNEVLATLWYDKLPIEIISGPCWVLDSTIYARGRPRYATSEDLVFICDNGLDKHAKIMHKLSEPMSTICTKRFSFDHFLVPLRPERSLTAGEIHEKMFASRRLELARALPTEQSVMSPTSSPPFTSDLDPIVKCPTLPPEATSSAIINDEGPFSKLDVAKSSRKRDRLNKIALKLAKNVSLELSLDIPDWLIKPFVNEESKPITLPSLINVEPETKTDLASKDVKPDVEGFNSEACGNAKQEVFVEVVEAKVEVIPEPDIIPDESTKSNQPTEPTICNTEQPSASLVEEPERLKDSETQGKESEASLPSSDNCVVAESTVLSTNTETTVATPGLDSLFSTQVPDLRFEDTVPSEIMEPLQQQQQQQQLTPPPQASMHFDFYN